MRSKRTSHPFSAWLSPKLWNLAPSIISARSSIDIVFIILALFGPLYEAHRPFLASSPNPYIKSIVNIAQSLCYILQCADIGF